MTSARRRRRAILDHNAVFYPDADDRSGRVLDFHALRHTTGAWAAIGGASPKAIQTLMRHSTITLTLDTYGHLLPDEAAETVARMPSVEPIPLRMTGTADDRGDNALEAAFSGSKVPATSPATLPDSTPSDARLAAIIDAWGTLPEAVRAGIAAMVAAARTTSETSQGER